MTIRTGLRYVKRLISKVVITPRAANCYDNVIGTIWSMIYGGYDKSHTGQIYVCDPSPAITPQWGGCYDNRPPFAIYEDYTTYTEVDPNSDITVTSSRITVDTMRRDVSAYVYKAKTISGNFIHLVDVRITAADNDGCWMPWALWSALGGEDQLRPAYNGIEVNLYRSTDGSTYSIWLREWYGNHNYDSGWTGVVLNTTYYLTIQRSGSTLTCKIYSDSSRTTLLATLSLVLHETVNYAYVYACQSCASAYAPAATISGYSENFSLTQQ